MFEDTGGNSGRSFLLELWLKCAKFSTTDFPEDDTSPSWEAGSPNMGNWAGMLAGEVLQYIQEAEADTRPTSTFPVVRKSLMRLQTLSTTPLSLPRDAGDQEELMQGNNILHPGLFLPLPSSSGLEVCAAMWLVGNTVGLHSFELLKTFFLKQLSNYGFSR